MTNWTRQLLKRGWRPHPKQNRWVHPQKPSGLMSNDGDWGYTLLEALVRAGLKGRTR